MIISAADDRRPSPPRSLHLQAATAALILLWQTGWAQESAPLAIDTVVVSATRTAQDSFAVPASIDRAEPPASGLGVNLSEALSGMPGLMARDRQNYAQDSQISIRGFGTRASFGIRGVRLYADGIPATQPDGQGQVTHFNLASADHIEVLRGPFSALYGNSSGGVIQIFTADGRDPPSLSAGFAGGSFDTERISLAAQGKQGIADYRLGYVGFHTGGYRGHSQAQRQSFNGKFNLQASDDDRLSLIVNAFASPAQDPLGLTAAQYQAKPRQSPVADQYKTRKDANQLQLGLNYQHRFSDQQHLNALVYYGQRGISQYLAIPISAQANPLHSGGVVDLGTHYGGSELRWNWSSDLLDRHFELTAGLSYDDLHQHRRGYTNFVGTELGVKGALRRNEMDDVDSFDQYLQGEWQLTPRVSLLAGARHSQIHFSSDDHYITAGNPDDSGQRSYSATTPVAGLLFDALPNLNLYAAYGKGFETPSFAELAYRPDGSSGLNFNLQSAHTSNLEVGAKLRLDAHTHASVALFQSRTHDELVLLSNSGGRSTYGNADRTLRQGVEASLAGEAGPRWHYQLAYTLLEATVRDGYLTCTTTPCTMPTNPVNAGNRLPGSPRNAAFAQLNWGAQQGWQLGADLRYFGHVPANDINTASASGYLLAGLDAAYLIEFAHSRLRGFINVDNLFDRRYVGSVIINDGNSRYFEPGPSISVLAGMQLELSR